ncbi:MAG TPA: serine/threonine-protein kinase [bacterium]|nr:serine/threonine-protein kinase [bacterium]
MDLRFPCDYGGYRLTGLLGTGGTAEVFRAETRTASGTVNHVAVRRIARAVEGEAQKILLEEASIWVSLRHPNIVTVVDIGQHENDWFLVLELVDGPSVDDLLRAGGAISSRESLAIAHRVALALHASHTLTVYGRKMEVVHRDVKPANVLIGKSGAVKLTDFGIARAVDRLGRTNAGIVKGSLHFLAPEQVRKEPLDPRTDLFQLGCTLHTMLTCRPLIDLPKDPLLRTLARGDIPAAPLYLPDPAQHVLNALLAPEPADRPASAAAAADLIANALAPESPAAIEAALSARVKQFDAARAAKAAPRPR